MPRPYAATLATAAAIMIAAPLAGATDRADAEVLVEDFFASLSAKDFDRIEAMFAPDATVLLPFAAGQDTIAAPAVFAGLEQLMGYYRGAGQRIAEVGFTDTEITVASEGNLLFVENVGDMVLPDGRRYENRYVWRFRIEEGQITEIWEYFDPKVADVAFGRE